MPNSITKSVIGIVAVAGRVFLPGFSHPLR
jgi:hypothetical protein